MMAEPHPLRCETCDFHGENQYMDFCGLYAMSSDDPTEIVNWIRQRGCASHSSAPSSDAVLDEKRTPIICLCGSTKFTREMLIKQWELTKQGYIVVSWCALPDDYYQGEEKTHVGDQEGVKEFVDEVHKRKIDLADESDDKIKIRIWRLARHRDKCKKNTPQWRKAQTQIDELYWVLGHG